MSGALSYSRKAGVLPMLNEQPRCLTSALLNLQIAEHKASIVVHSLSNWHAADQLSLLDGICTVEAHQSENGLLRSKS